MYDVLAAWFLCFFTFVAVHKQNVEALPIRMMLCFDGAKLQLTFVMRAPIARQPSSVDAKFSRFAFIFNNNAIRLLCYCCPAQRTVT